MTGIYSAIGETAAAPGTGAVALGGALAGHKAFDDTYSRIAHPATAVSVLYRIELADDSTVYEHGRGSYTKSGPDKTLVRSQVYESSAANTTVDFDDTVNVYIVGFADAFGPLTGCRIYGLTGGSSTAYTATMKPALVELVDGMLVMVEIHTTSGAAPTFSPDGLTARNIVDNSGANLAAGALIGNSTVFMRYRASGTKWWLVGGFSGGTVPTTITMGTGTQILVPVGSAAAPSIARSGNPDTGVHFPTDQVAVSINGTNQLVVGAGGLVVASSIDVDGNITLDGTIAPGGGVVTIGGLAGSGLINEASSVVIRRSSSPDTRVALSTTGFDVGIGGATYFTLGGSAANFGSGIDVAIAGSLTVAGNTLVNANGYLLARSFANFAALPSAGANAGAVVLCLANSSPGGPTLAVSNGSNWYSNGAVLS